MKSMKKLFSMLVAVCLMVVLCIPAFAADTTYTITITNSNSGHTYGAYQVFDGDLSSDGVLSNITWGSGVNGTAILSALNGSTDPAPYADAKAVAEALANSTLSVADFAQIVGANLGTATATSTQKNDKTGYTISITDPGYYFVKDQNAVTGDDTATGYILEVVKDVTVNPKGDKPSVVKKVKDVNDSEAAGDTNPTNWQDSADYDINDNVPYQLTGTLPTNYADYTTYYYEFTDTLSKGLTYNNDAKVYVVNGETKTDVTSSFDITSSNVTSGDYAGGTALSIKCENLKGLKDSSGNALVSATSKIVVEYSAKLNGNAVVGSAGNPNKVTLTYSNNPNKDKGGEHGTTPEDKNIVFTYKVVVNKLDKDNAALAGAGFTLYKNDADATTEDKWVAVGTATATGDGSNVFTWSGLDDGKYKLVESTTPAGYNTMDDQYFTVAATHTDGDNPTLSTLTGTKEEGSTITFTPDTSAGSLTSNVINYKGSELPSTGGIGTTIFYVVGGIMAAGAAILLITKKRMGNDAE